VGAAFRGFCRSTGRTLAEQTRRLDGSGLGYYLYVTPAPVDGGVRGGWRAVLGGRELTVAGKKRKFGGKKRRGSPGWATGARFGPSARGRAARRVLCRDRRATAWQFISAHPIDRFAIVDKAFCRSMGAGMGPGSRGWWLRGPVAPPDRAPSARKLGSIRRPGIASPRPIRSGNPSGWFLVGRRLAAAMIPVKVSYYDPDYRRPDMPRLGTRMGFFFCSQRRTCLNEITLKPSRGPA